MTIIPRHILPLAAAFALLLLLAAPAEAGHRADGAFDDSNHVRTLNQSARDNWVGALMHFTQTNTAIMMQQAIAFGAFMDAKHQLETQRLFGELRAQAHKDYASSEQMCRYGTQVRSLAASERRGQVTAQMINQAMLQRQTLRAGSTAADGAISDKRARLDRFRQTNCNPDANGGTLSTFCATGGVRARIDKDVDFTRSFDQRYTLDVNLMDATSTSDEQDVMALSKNLFGHTIFDYIPETALVRRDNHREILAMRSIHALRSVPQNSFSTMIGMKAQGTGGVNTFLKSVMGELGVAAADLDAFAGQNPSYYAQMEVLTRKMTQNPAFFTNLYTSPENVRRAGVAIQAIGLMQDRDRYEGALRREMLASLMLEMKLRASQEETERAIRRGRAELFRD